MYQAGVAHRAWAWVETKRPRYWFSQRSLSPTVRGRGLKPLSSGAARKTSGSPTVRGRGLKLERLVFVEVGQVVAHRAWAWVETPG